MKKVFAVMSVLLTMVIFACSQSPEVITRTNGPAVDAGPSDSITQTGDASSVSPTAMECPVGENLCGDSYCLPQGITCCASVGHPELGCSNGSECTSSGICIGQCKIDTTLSCTHSASAYSCTGSTAPTDTDPTLNCSDGTQGSNQTIFCCLKQCSKPKGTYSFVFTTMSGTCGDIPSSKTVYNGNDNLLIVGATAEISPSNVILNQVNQNVSDDACTGSLSATFMNNGGATVFSGSDVVSVSSDQDGKQFTGTVSISERDGTGNVICDGTYSFVAQFVSN